MSFMFKPFDFEDMTAVNYPFIPQEVVNRIVSGTENVSQSICKSVEDHFANDAAPTYILCLDGFVGARWSDMIQRIEKTLVEQGIELEVIEIERVHKQADEIEAMLADNLPQNREIDPVLLYGRVFEGTYEDFVDGDKLNSLINLLSAYRRQNGKKAVVVYGNGSAIARLRNYYDMVLYFDVTPLEMTHRINRGEVRNLGKTEGYEFRRFYYVDFEVAYKLRDELIQNGMDYYVESNKPDNLFLIPKETFDQIMSILVKYPFRCKPVYLEGIWGGFYFKRLRGLPEDMKNSAWVFDLIPNEVSLLVKIGEHFIDFPFLTFVKKMGRELLGETCVNRFGGIFPIRFNYDDTYHSNGNMSIQVHPTREYAVEVFNEQFQQDEAYYTVQVGHNAKTYLGFKENVNVDDFFADVKKSEETLEAIDHDKYINSVPSKPGVQFLIPAGTIHASGRNQVVLEIGSCTMGSMTFKQYDYVRKDSNGKLRPIHTIHGKNVIQRDRTERWVGQNLVQKPRLVAQGEGWKEFIVGEFDSIFFSLRRLEFDRVCYQNTDDQFHVLTLVDGEKALIQSVQHPEFSFTQKFLDIVVVPANMGDYVIKNLSIGPICMHKAMVKPE